MNKTFKSIKKLKKKKKILYSINSEGMGHALRSKPVIEYLLSKGHSVKILTSGRCFEYLKQHFNDIEKIHETTLTYKNNRACYAKTFFRFWWKFHSLFKKSIIKIWKIHKSYNPDIVIVDFEVMTGKISKVLRKPIISIDNISMIKLTKTPSTSMHKWSHFVSYCINEIFNIGANHYFVTTFFRFPIRYNRHKKRVSFIQPIVRKELIKQKSDKKDKTKKDLILVYQTSRTNENLIPTLQKFPKEEFVYYGHFKQKTSKNVKFKPFSDKEFIRDLVSSKAIITNGGYTLISEALFLGKPILANPIRRQYEQHLNALMIEKKGYGLYAKHINHSNLSKFLKNLSSYKRNLSKYKQIDNREFFKELDKKIISLIRK